VYGANDQLTNAVACAWFELHPNLRYIKNKVPEPDQFKHDGQSEDRADEETDDPLRDVKKAPGLLFPRLEGPNKKQRLVS
jgi:hypothetical protein